MSDQKKVVLVTKVAGDLGKKYPVLDGKWVAVLEDAPPCYQPGDSPEEAIEAWKKSWSVIFGEVHFKIFKVF